MIEDANRILNEEDESDTCRNISAKPTPSEAATKENFREPSAGVSRRDRDHQTRSRSDSTVSSYTGMPKKSDTLTSLSIFQRPRQGRQLLPSVC